jgi:cardiolipin synthase
MAVLTLANQLTLLRMLLIPAFVILIVYGEMGWALLTFLVAGITDALDGLIARWTDQNTTLGAWLDPMADKLLLISTFVVLTLPGIGLVSRIPLWLTVCLISRDITIVLTVIIVNLAIGRRTFRPTLLGKVATGVYILTGFVFLVVNYLGRPSPVTDVMVYVALIITILSALHYIRHAGRIISESS